MIKAKLVNIPHPDKFTHIDGYLTLKRVGDSNLLIMKCTIILPPATAFSILQTPVSGLD